MPVYSADERPSFSSFPPLFELGGSAMYETVRVSGNRPDPDGWPLPMVEPSVLRAILATVEPNGCPVSM